MMTSLLGGVSATIAEFKCPAAGSSTGAPSAEGARPTTPAQVQTIALDQPDGFKPIHVGIDVVKLKDREAGTAAHFSNLRISRPATR